MIFIGIDFVVVLSIQSFDLVLFLLTSFLQLLDLFINILNLFELAIFVRFVFWLFRDGRYFCSVIDGFFIVLETELDRIFILSFVGSFFLSVSAHVEIKLKMIRFKRHISLFSFLILLSEQQLMIKVQSLFPECSPRKQVEIQTEIVFPQLKAYRKRQIMTKDHQQQPCFQKTAFTYKSTPSHNCCFSSYSSPNKQQHNKNGPISKVKDEGNGQRGNIIKSIETKNFKFLKLEERTLHIAIGNYIRGCVCSREENKLLSKKIKLPYFKGQKISIFSCKHTEKSINIPQVNQIQAQIKEIIDIVTYIYQNKAKQGQNTSVMMKNIGLTIKRVVSEKKYQHLEISEASSQQLLKHYLEKYIDEIQKEKKASKYGEKSFLLRFYQQIYDRYERKPFACIPDEENECKQNSISKQQLAEQTPPLVKISQGRKKATVNESFIKMRFYNNFRRQVEHLSENTEKILNEQMNRLNHV